MIWCVTFTGWSFIGNNSSSSILVKVLFKQRHTNTAPIIGYHICLKQVHTDNAPTSKGRQPHKLLIVLSVCYRCVFLTCDCFFWNSCVYQSLYLPWFTTMASFETHSLPVHVKNRDTPRCLIPTYMLRDVYIYIYICIYAYTIYIYIYIHIHT